MTRSTFFKVIPTLIELKLLNNYFNLTKEKDRRINKKYYKYYISLIKQYRYLGVFPNNGALRFIKIN